jgi:hypothetical protein
MPAALEVRVDLAGLSRLGNLLAAAGDRVPLALARAVNHTGAKARTAMIGALVPQTGLKYRTLRRALKQRQMWPGRSGAYVIRASGGNIRLKYFAARETLRGVSAAPWGRRQVYPGTFIKGGRFPGRIDLGMGGQVFRRAGGAGRTPIEIVRSGLYIGEEMGRGLSRAAFFAVVDRDLAARIGHELGRLLAGGG